MIARVPTAVAAFVGRTVKGPVNQPVVLTGFSDFQRVFGGLWQPALLAYAVEQFFDHGGQRCIVVRVANGGCAPGILLPAGGTVLQLRGRCPGTREYLRASVDYDAIGTLDDSFNLVVQRLRAPGSEFIEEQESFRRVSVDPVSPRFVADVLAQSRLVRVEHPVPPVRPDRTPGSRGAAVGYVTANVDGDDGAPLTDYDLIGDAECGTGLFALRGAEPFNFLYLPPPARDQDVGLSALLVGARLCRERQAMLIIDPPAAWDAAATALAQLPEWPLRSEDALMYFPRIQAPDRLRGHYGYFGSGAAVAGMLARADRSCPLWSAARGADGVLAATLRPAVTVTPTQRTGFAGAGVNVLPGACVQQRDGGSARTLVPWNGARAGERFLAARRLALFVVASVVQGTRWAVFEHSGPPLWQRLQAQVSAFLAGLDGEGAFVGATPEEKYFVVCDERLNGATSAQQGSVRLLLGFTSVRPGEFHTWLVTQRADGGSVQPVSVNRLALGGGHFDEQFEHALLRTLAPGL